MRYFGFIIVLLICCEAKYIPENGIYSVCDEMPKYGTGMHELEAHIVEQTAELDQSTPGSVFVSFIVNAQGQLENVKVVKSINEKQDQLALEAIKEAPGKWMPGTSSGKPVSVKMTYPVNFK